MDKLSEIYQTVITKQEFYDLFQSNSFDISWLKPKLETKDYLNLEDIIFDYVNKNDELLFKAGFRYAWALFLQCNK